MSMPSTRRSTTAALIQIRPGDERAAVQALIAAGIWCRVGDLSNNEAKVVACIAKGMQSKEIAEQMNINYKTVDEYVKRARAKMGATNRAEMAAFAVRMGLVTL